MESGQIDNIKNTVMTNPVGAEGGKNNLALKDYVFLPIVEIVEYTPFSVQEHIDVWSNF